MEVFAITFPGHYVGGSAVVMAESREQAIEFLKAKLAEHGLTGDEIKPSEVYKIDIEKAAPGVLILADGDY